MRKPLTDEQKAAQRARGKAWAKANPGKIAKANKKWRETNPEKARGRKSKEETAAYARQYQIENKDEIAAAKAIYAEKNREKIRAQRAAYRAANKEKISLAKKLQYIKDRDKTIARSAVWAKGNGGKVSAIRTKWKKGNPDKVTSDCNRRRASKLNATPNWGDKTLIDAVYKTARTKKVTCGGEWQVDHIVPLRSKLVCGLHVEHNLRVIPKMDNIKKSNRHWPDMPC